MTTTAAVCCICAACSSEPVATRGAGGARPAGAMGAGGAGPAGAMRAVGAGPAGAMRAVGALCRGCAAAIADGQQRAPGIVSTRQLPEKAAAWLVDAWGQLHPVEARCRVGRERDGNDLVIADLMVSAEHAELRRDVRGEWRVRDRGSANGTGVDDEPRAREAVLAHKGRVWFGTVAFYFWADAEPPSHDVPRAQIGTLVPDPAAFRLSAPAHGALTVRAVAGHPVARAPGELEYVEDGAGRARRVAVARLQFQLLRALCEAALRHADALRGKDERAAYVGTHELIASLPFNTARPEPNHVRQVVASLRSTLERAGLPAGVAGAGAGGLIHSSEGLGYRVTWDVRRLGSA